MFGIPIADHKTVPDSIFQGSVFFFSFFFCIF